MSDEPDNPFEPSADDDAFHEQMNRSVYSAIEQLEKIGIFTQEASLGALPTGMLDMNTEMPAHNETMREAFEGGKLTVQVAVTAKVGDIAFSDRVLNPETYEMEQGFRKSLPTEEEAGLRAMIEDITHMMDEDE